MSLSEAGRCLHKRMKQPAQRIACALAVTGFLAACLPDSARAVNTGFLPGDACFGSWLSGETIAELDSGEAVQFGYRRGPGAFTLCGYAGYWRLDVREIPGGMREGLSQVYEDLRRFIPATYEITADEEGRENRSETNPFQIFIYNRSYDIRRGIGLKLNEHWMNLVDYKRGEHYPGVYAPYLLEYDPTVRDWEHATQVPGLKINETDAKPLWGPQVDTPVTLNAEDIQILVLPDRLHESHALARHLSPHERILDYFYRVTSDGVTKCHWNEYGNFIEQSWPADDAELAARQRQARLREALDSLNGALSDTYGIEEESLPDDFRKRLEQLREVGDDVVNDLEKLSTHDRKPSSSEVTPDSW